MTLLDRFSFGLLQVHGLFPCLLVVSWLCGSPGKVKMPTETQKLTRFPSRRSSTGRGSSRSRCSSCKTPRKRLTTRILLSGNEFLPAWEVRLHSCEHSPIVTDPAALPACCRVRPWMQARVIEPCVCGAAGKPGGPGREGVYYLIQVVDAEGKKIEPAFSQWVKAMNAPEAGNSPGIITYHEATK